MMMPGSNSHISAIARSICTKPEDSLLRFQYRRDSNSPMFCAKSIIKKITRFAQTDLFYDKAQSIGEKNLCYISIGAFVLLSLCKLTHNLRKRTIRPSHHNIEKLKIFHRAGESN